MTGKPWFRMYHEMIEDPKVGTLNDAEFRLWVELLCLACKECDAGDTGMTESELDWKLRRNVSETLLKLSMKHLIITKNGQNGRKTVSIKNWKKRQFESDSSTKRVRKYRERQAKLKVVEKV